MKVYVGLVLFSKIGNTGYVLGTIDNDIPMFYLDDSAKSCERIIREQLENITGISVSWTLPCRQEGAFESYEGKERIIHIVYSIYLDGKQSLRDEISYRWMTLAELDRIGSEFNNIVRYISTKRF